MNKDAIIKLVNEQMWPKTDADVPSFKAGDTITVSYKIVEGNKERVQSFRGVVIQIKGSGKTKMFTIRKISNGVGVERIFPLYSPHIDKIEVNKIGVVRRARIYYLRDLTGKKARIKEKRMTRTEKKYSRGRKEKTGCLKRHPVFLRPKEARNRPETSENDAAGLFSASYSAWSRAKAASLQRSTRPCRAATSSGASPRLATISGVSRDGSVRGRTKTPKGIKEMKRL